MKNKKITLVFFFIFGFATSLTIIQLMAKFQKDDQVEAPIVVSATELVELYQKDEAAANLKFSDKVLQVTGTVDTLETNSKGQTVAILGGPEPLPRVYCTLKEKQDIKTGKTLTLEGRGIEYHKDVFLIDCSIIQ